MKSIWMTLASLVLALPVVAQPQNEPKQRKSEPPPPPAQEQQPRAQQPPAPTPKEPQTQERQGKQVSGKIVSRTKDSVVVQTVNNQRVTLYVSPQTRYLVNRRAVQFADLPDGSTINAYYLVEGDRWIANSLAVEAANPGVAPAQAANEMVFVDAKVLRVTPPDQFVFRTSDNKDVIVHVTQHTAVQVNNNSGQLADIKAGGTFDVYYSVVDGRNVATRIVSLTLLEGQVSRVVGEDQVVIRNAQGQDVTVYVSPQTMYRFGSQTGGFRELRPGMPISVYYDTSNSRNRAFRILRR